jgi:iron(III) transport system substrate-binding protein
MTRHLRFKRSASLLTAIAGLAAVLASTACGGGGGELTIYAGRSQQLVQPLLEQFSKDTGIKIRVRYGDGTDLALGILEEGDNSPADVYYGQDVGALGALRSNERLAPLPQNILDKVQPAYRSSEGVWVGISGRARVMVYNTDKFKPADLPASALDYTAPQWRNKVGFVPRSDGFPEFVTALREIKGEQFAKDWLTALRANNARAYGNNLSAIQAVANGEIDVAYLNHYYLYRFIAEQGEGFKARNYFFTNGDIGGLFLVSGAAIINTSKHKDEAAKFIDYLLSPSAQKYFTDNTYEYPMIPGIQPGAALPDLSGLKPPNIDLSDLTDLRGSLDLLRQTGLLP